MLVMGVTGLVLDAGRIFVVNTSVQAYVDQIALASATELDGQDGARQRARLAAFGASVDSATHYDNTLKKLMPFGDDNDLYGLNELIFIKEIFPDSGFQFEVADLLVNPSTGASNLATTDAEAEYVIVIAEPSSITTTLLRFARLGSGSDEDLGGVPDSLATTAVAVAGLEDGGFCDNASFMFCNPLGSTPLSTIGVNGRQLLLKNHSGGATAWSPGNFSTIVQPDDVYGECPDSAGGAASRQRCLFAINSLNRSCSSMTVDMDPGQSNSVMTGMNVWFAKYDSQTDQWMNDNRFSPDFNVIKGEQYDPKNPSQECRSAGYQAWDETVYLPRESCLTQAGGCAAESGYERISNPVTAAQLAAYWSTNHGDHGGANPGFGNYYDASLEADAATITDPMTGDPLELDTRYGLYVYETMSGDTYLPEVGVTPGMTEDGTSDNNLCSSAEPEMFRRVVIMASVDCDTEGVNGSANGVGVQEYFYGLVTEPMKDNDDTSSEDDLFVELIRPITSDADPLIIHAYPVIHR